jgi:hypothetical protein
MIQRFRLAAGFSEGAASYRFGRMSCLRYLRHGLNRANSAKGCIRGFHATRPRRFDKDTAMELLNKTKVSLPALEALESHFRTSNQSIQKMSKQIFSDILLTKIGLKDQNLSDRAYIAAEEGSGEINQTYVDSHIVAHSGNRWK